MKVTVSDWKAYEGTGALKGFFKVKLDTYGLVIKCTLFKQDSGARWIGLPQKSWQKRNGQTAYEDQIDYINQDVEELFHAEVFAQLDKLRNDDESELEPEPPSGQGPSTDIITNDDIPF
jgi:hypothetical protein